MSAPGRVARLGMVARWKPVHRGHAAVLQSLLERADHVRLGLGSSNRYGLQNPFTAAESAEMIRRVLGPPARYDLVEVPDLGHGPRWRAMVAELFGPLDLFVTANPYVRELMREIYRVVHPVTLVPPERRLPVDGTAVRRAMARGEEWREMVPPEVATYLQEEGLVRRFRSELGLATLELDAPSR